MTSIIQSVKYTTATMLLLWAANGQCATTVANHSAPTTEQRLVKYVHKTVATARHNHYELGGEHVDTKHGVYRVDCSHYIDHILQAVYPRAYSSLVHSTGSARPASQHYYDFFSRLPSVPKRYWSKVEKVKQLHPGDVLVFRYQATDEAAAG